MSAGFTPGPWQWVGTDEIEQVEHPFTSVAEVVRVPKNGDPEGEQACANARLIAIAPELYERVRSSSVALEEAAKLLEGNGLSGCASIMRGYVVANDAALAKASGDIPSGRSQ